MLEQESIDLVMDIFGHPAGVGGGGVQIAGGGMGDDDLAASATADFFGITGQHMSHAPADRTQTKQANLYRRIGCSNTFWFRWMVRAWPKRL